MSDAKHPCSGGLTARQTVIGLSLSSNIKMTRRFLRRNNVWPEWFFSRTKAHYLNDDFVRKCALRASLMYKVHKSTLVLQPRWSLLHHSLDEWCREFLSRLGIRWNKPGSPRHYRDKLPSANNRKERRRALQPPPTPVCPEAPSRETRRYVIPARREPKAGDVCDKCGARLRRYFSSVRSLVSEPFDDERFEGRYVQLWARAMSGLWTGQDLRNYYGPLATNHRVEVANKRWNACHPVSCPNGPHYESDDDGDFEIPGGLNFSY